MNYDHPTHLSVSGLHQVVDEPGLYEFHAIDDNPHDDDGLGPRIYRWVHVLRFAVNARHEITDLYYVKTIHYERKNKRRNGSWVEAGEPIEYALTRSLKNNFLEALRTAWSVYSIGYHTDAYGIVKHWRQPPNRIDIPMLTDLKQ
jgi:hypothetical protein